mmetsp:Transcript_28653/g.32747  ORF Transcript_28653/g.32747 Transcript_28653/m.32747 type:complete len:96 (+) Transcript_28653:56-343(+)
MLPKIKGLKRIDLGIKDTDLETAIKAIENKKSLQTIQLKIRDQDIHNESMVKIQASMITSFINRNFLKEINVRVDETGYGACNYRVFDTRWGLRV